LEKKRVKGLSGIFNRINLIAVMCVLSFIAGAAYTKARRPITLLNATATESETDTQPLASEYEVTAGPKQAAPAGDDSEANLESSSEWQTIRMRVTGYCPCPKCCGQYSDGVTACGHKIKPGDTFVAADKRYSFGTEMVIAGYGSGQPVKVLDRGGAIKGNRLDAFFASHQEALEWGVRNIDVKVRNK
jgi:3D (Asp-Asp-Asp) domain-containing protein